MLPETSAAWQTALAQAVRNGTSPDEAAFPSERLAVYARLVRNNIFGFVNRCFTETRPRCPTEQWAQLLEDFVRDGQAHTPYFQEIASEFYHFCRENNRLPEYLLDLMDLELAQLAVEVAVSDCRTMQNDTSNHDTELVLSSVAQLRHYPEEHASQYAQGQLAAAGSVLVWRDTHDDVRWCALDPIDAVLLGLTEQQAYSLTRILTELAQLMPDEGTWKQTLSDSWHYWTEQGVLVKAA